MVIALREIRTVSNGQIKIDLPDYINTDMVEVIIMPYSTPDTKNSKKIDYNKYFGVSNLGTELIDKYSKEVRNEWDREISD